MVPKGVSDSCAESMVVAAKQAAVGDATTPSNMVAPPWLQTLHGPVAPNTTSRKLHGAPNCVTDLGQDVSGHLRRRHRFSAVP